MAHLPIGAHSFSTATGATLTYFVAGHGPHLLVHIAPGWGAASVMYQNTFTHLEDTFTFVYIEVRGTRGSSFPEDLSEMSSWHMAEDVEALRVHLGRETIDVSGHSNGGCIALWYASRFPTHVRKLVLLEAQVYGAGVGAEATKAILEGRPDKEVVGAFVNLNLGAVEDDEAFGAAMGGFLPLYVAKPERDLETFKAAFTNIPQVKCIKTQAMAEAQHADQAEHLSKITAQTLVIVGRHDFITPVPVSELIVSRVPNATLHIFEDSGHLPWVEEKDKFYAVVRAFFA
ncbi:alpha/beta hydrolase fold protein [Exidia glandulosa HHB12029]|uniref:Alpha/beta hydrolase fold protein n=1 Tax=Exidia glandulosa HHB12029 TaxID=1314781 RepID=A0A165EQY9_EXIGL|nr:alpha/beta hydrolase fold protein [Exidia glandulosa HHB12029]